MSPRRFPFGILSRTSFRYREFFVSDSLGNDANPGTYASPLKTISAAAALSLRANDRVRFRCADAFTRPGNYNAALWAPTADGIRIMSYGSGAAPILNGSIVLSGWTSDGGNVWKAACTVTYSAGGAGRQCFVDDVRLKRNTTSRASLAQGEFYQDDPNDLVYVWLADDGDPSTHTVRFTNCNAGLDLSDRLDIIVDGLDVRQCMGSAFNIRGTAKRIQVSNCYARWGGRGFDIGMTVGVNTYLDKADITIAGCTAHDTLGEGVWAGAVRRAIIERCTVYNGGKDRTSKGYAAIANACASIALADDARNCTVRQCETYSGYAGTSGCMDVENENSLQPIDNLIERCFFHTGAQTSVKLCTDAGLRSIWRSNVIVQDNTGFAGECFRAWNGCNGLKFYGNTVIEQGASNAVNITGATAAVSNVDFRNNAVWGASVSSMRNVIVDASAQTGLTINRNGYGKSRDYWIWGAANKTSMADWQAACGQEADSIGTATDPLYVTPYVAGSPSRYVVDEAADVALQAGSPYKGAGVALADLTTDYTGATRASPPSIGAYE